MEISPDLCRQAIQKVADYFNLSIDEAALGIIKIVNINMSGLLQSMTVKRGYDPREFAIVAMGGAGPIHAASIAKELSIPTVIVPPFPGVFSAWGMLMADLRHDFGQTYIKPMDDADVDSINGIFRELEVRVKELFERENITEERIVLSYAMDLRYCGQEHTLSVPAPPKLGDADKSSLNKSFDELHLQVYGHNAPEEPKEIVSVNVMSFAKVKKPTLETIPRGSETPVPEAVLGKRKVYVGNGTYQEFDLFQRDKLLSGNTLSGPALIGEATATTVVETDQVCSVDPYGNLIITLNQEGP